LRNKFAGMALLWLACMNAVGCGYHVAGHSSALPSTWRTIAVPAFANKTSYYRIEQVFTEATIHELLARTKYRIIQDPDAADGVLHGEITKLETAPLLFNQQTEQVTTVLVTVHAKISLVDRVTQKTVYKNDDVVLRDEYQISSDVKQFFQEENPAVRRMAADFASRAVANLLENF
jgi:hypothetical protein